MGDAYYARAGGVTIEELARLEAHFVKLLDWTLHVSPIDYLSYRWLAVAHQTKVPRSSLASICTTTPASSPTHSDDEDASEWTDESGGEECLPGRPLWGARSYRIEAGGYVEPEVLEALDDGDDLQDSYTRSLHSSRFPMMDCDEYDKASKEYIMPDKSMWYRYSATPHHVLADCDKPDDADCYSSRPPLVLDSSQVANIFLTSGELGESDDEDCFPGMPLWSVASYVP